MYVKALSTFGARVFQVYIILFACACWETFSVHCILSIMLLFYCSCCLTTSLKEVTTAETQVNTSRWRRLFHPRSTLLLPSLPAPKTNCCLQITWLPVSLWLAQGRSWCITWPRPYRRQNSTSWGGAKPTCPPCWRGLFSPLTCLKRTRPPPCWPPPNHNLTFDILEEGVATVNNWLS